MTSLNSARATGIGAPKYACGKRTTFRDMNAMDKFINHILENEFSYLPRWVDRKMFMEDKTEELKEMIFNSEDDELCTYELESFVCPFISVNINLGASGGLDGKYNIQYKFPSDLLEYLKREEKD